MKMKRMTTYVVRAGVCCALLVACAQPGRAQTVELPQVPDGIADDVKTMLSTRRVYLVEEEARLRATAADHNEKCRQVVAESGAAAACAARKDSLHKAAVKLKLQKDQYVNAVNELDRLTAEESALSQAISASVEEMRSLVNDASEAGQDRLRQLSELLTQQMERRKQFRVRRTAAVAAVRG